MALDNLRGGTKRVVEENTPLNNLRGGTKRVVIVDGGGGKSVPQYATMPTADASNADNIVQYKGETDATYTNGYFYKNVGTTTPSSASAAQTVGATLSDIAVDVDTLEAFTGWTTDNSLQIFYTADGWSVDTTSLGVTYTGTPNVGDAITITYTAESTSYAWTQWNVQPGDDHNKGYYADLTALQTAYPTGEDGDYAIVGSTDTVWVWDSGTSAWVDTDTKGEVTSVNGQTGAVTLSIPDAVQYSTMPTASADNLGDIVQFTGTTDANYTNGYFYQCVSDGQEPATYSWSQTNVQPAPSGLPDQTGQSGKFLTTDGTDASWSDKPLVNGATQTTSVDIVGSGGSKNYNKTTVLGKDAFVYGDESVAIGYNAHPNQNSVSVGLGAGGGNNSVSVGKYSGSGVGKGCVSIGHSAGVEGYKNYGIAIGNRVHAAANGAIQLGSSQTDSGSITVINSDANTFKVANANGNFEIMSADGTIPEARLADTTNAQQGDVLTLDSTGNAVWQAGGSGTSSITVTLAAASWSGGSQTVTATGVTASNTVIIGAAPASQAEYSTSGVLCTAQAADSLTFTCTSTPSNDLTVNVIIL